MAVYTTAPVTGSWARAVMIWAVACPNTNFLAIEMPKNVKKAMCDRLTDGRTDGPTDRHGDL